jgi:hypothetical protein
MGDQIWETAVASPKCPSGVCPGNSTTYSPAPISFTTTSDRSGNRSGSAAWRLTKNTSSARAEGSAGSDSPNFAATSAIFAQRSGERTTRRKDGRALLSR